jgi:adenylate cyclase
LNKLLPIFLGIFFVIATVLILLTSNDFIHSLVNRLDNISYDLQLRARVLTHHEAPHPSIAIIDIDDKSLQAEGRWPWPRSKLAELVNQLKALGVAMIAFDMFFSESQPNIADQLIDKIRNTTLSNTACLASIKSSEPLFDEDTPFTKSLTNANSILAIAFLPQNHTENQLPPPLMQLTSQEQEDLGIINASGYIASIPQLQQAAKGVGFVNVNPDTDGIARRAMLIMQYNGGVYPSLSLQAAMNLFGDTIKLITPRYDNVMNLEGLQLGNVRIPTDENGQLLIPFIGKSHTFPYYSATDILQGKIPKDALLGKIVIVGTTAVGLADIHSVAIQNVYPGLEVQATLLNGLLQNNFAYIPAWAFGENLTLVILMGLIAAFLFPYCGPKILMTVMILFPLTLFMINHSIWDHSGIILSFLIPGLVVDVMAFLNMMFGYVFETRKKEHLKNLFGQYVPEKHIDAMLVAKSTVALKGEDRAMSVLFADIRNFTSISEKMSAQNVVKILNDYLTPMTEIIFKYKGTIDKYVGDLIMAFWGAPLADADHARHAIESAIDMQSKVKIMAALFKENKIPEFKIGVGINTGVMMVGDMGSRFRRNYTVMGDSVNLASRLEGLTKFYGVDILVSEYTQSSQDLFVFKMVDKIKVKGRHEALMIYEVICKKADITSQISAEITLFHDALEFYFKQDWQHAESLMSKLHGDHPDKKLYKLFIDRIENYKKQALPRDWDGVYEHITKS